MISRTPYSERKRTAVIDLGSNSARVIIMSYHTGSSYHLEDEIREIVRLREGMTASGLSEAAMQRGIFTLQLFSHFCESLGVEHVIATATSAVREAANGEDFLERVERELGLKLRILEGDEEAYYGVLGALGAIEMTNGVVIDIGGGSAQLSQVKDRRFVRGQALTLGALALTEKFVRTDPISKADLRAVEGEIERQLDEVKWLPFEKGQLIGLGGTIRNLAKIAAAREKYPLQSVNGYSLTLASLEESINQLIQLPLAQRRKIPGLVRDRADIILPGALVVRAVLQRLGRAELSISEKGLREGLFFEEFWSDLPYPAVSDLRQFSVLNLARFYEFQEAHAYKVRHLCRRLFDQLQSLHGMGDAERELLSAAAILHDIGTKIRYNDHHKHSQTLILSSGLPGFSPREVALISLLARFHRKGTPSAGSFAPLLEPADAVRLTQLSAILRLAEYLERGRSGAVQDLRIESGSRSIKISLLANIRPTVEMWVAERNGLELMQSAFDRAITLGYGGATT